MKTFSLSLSKLSQLNFDLYEKDFKFIYCQEAFPCNKLVADFLSPIVQKIHMADPTFDEFVIPDDERYPPSIFKEVIKTGEFQDIQLTEKNAKALRYFYSKIGNNEFSEFILFGKEESKRDSLTVNSVFQQLRIKLAIGISVSQEIEFIASHLYSFEKQIEKEKNILTLDILQMILSSPKICISKEEWLFEYILKRSEEEKEFLCLFEYVKFNYLNKESVQTFFKKVPVYEMNQNVYNSIIELAMSSFESKRKNIKEEVEKSSRYYHDPKEKAAKEKAEKEKSQNKKLVRRVFNFDGKNPMNGLFSFLRKTVSNGQNINDSDVIDITSTSNSNNSNSNLSNLVDCDTKTVFMSKNEPNQSITFDFKERRVLPTCYCFITSPAESNNMKSWVVEVSNDNKNFTIITSESENETLRGNGTIVVFRVFSPQQGRYVRIRQTASNWNNNNILSLAQVEIFGEILEETD